MYLILMYILLCHDMLVLQSCAYVVLTAWLILTIKDHIASDGLLQVASIYLLKSSNYLT